MAAGARLLINSRHDYRSDCGFTFLSRLQCAHAWALRLKVPPMFQNVHRRVLGCVQSRLVAIIFATLSLYVLYRVHFRIPNQIVCCYS
jgi:hypothetical protein